MRVELVSCVLQSCIGFLDSRYETNFSLHKLVLCVDIVLYEFIETNLFVSIDVAVLEDYINDLNSVILIDSSLFEIEVHFMSVYLTVSISIKYLKVSPQSQLLIVCLLLSILLISCHVKLICMLLQII